MKTELQTETSWRVKTPNRKIVFTVRGENNEWIDEISFIQVQNFPCLYAVYSLYGDLTDSFHFSPESSAGAALRIARGIRRKVALVKQVGHFRGIEKETKLFRLYIMRLIQARRVKERRESRRRSRAFFSGATA